MGVAHLTSAQASELAEPLVIPFVPGTPVTLDWHTDIGSDRVDLLNCEPLTELAKSYGICEAIFSSGEQRTLLVLGEKTPSTSQSSIGFNLPRPKVRLSLELKSIDVEFVPLIPFVPKHSEGQYEVAITQAGQYLDCNLENAELSKMVVAKKWVIENSSNAFKSEFEVNSLPVSSLRDNSRIECQIILFDGLLFQKLVKTASSKIFTRLEQERKIGQIDESESASRSVPSAENAIAPRIASAAFIFVPAGETRAHIQVDAILPPQNAAPRWNCTSLDPTVSCSIKSVLQTQVATVVVQGQLTSNSAVLLEMRYPQKNNSITVRKTVPVVFDLPLARDRESILRLQEKRDGTFHCQSESSVNTPQDVLWYKNSKEVPEWRGSAWASFPKPSSPQKIACLSATPSNGRMAFQWSEILQLPPEPKIENLPSQLLMSQEKSEKIKFFVSSERGKVEVKCFEQTSSKKQDLCQELPSGKVGWQAFSLPSDVQSLASAKEKTGIVQVQILANKAYYTKEIPYIVLTTYRRLNILSVVAFAGDNKTGHCVFLAQDPFQNHFTARVLWQGDPGRSQDFSTFFRNETIKLIPAGEYFRNPALERQNLFVGKATFHNSTGTPICNVVASNGVLFTATNSVIRANEQTAKLELLAHAHNSTVPQKHALSSFTLPRSQILESPARGDNARVFRFQAGEEAELGTNVQAIHQCTGNESLCHSLDASNGKLRAFNTTQFPPSIAFLSYRQSDGKNAFAVVELQNTAYSGRAFQPKSKENCAPLIKSFLNGELPSTTLLTLQNESGANMSLSQWASLDAAERKKAQCSLNPE